MYALFAAFLITALVYSSVGFGGGSTYNALLVLYGVDYPLIPVLSLICNIVVVAGGVRQFNRHKHLDVRRIFPLTIYSIPASFIGGYLKIPESLFSYILGLALLASGIKLLWPERSSEPPILSCEQPSVRPAYTYPLLGGSLGFLAGVTGIGGGIFLAPALYFLKWGTPQQISAGSAFFILVNSLAGLCGQVIKFEGVEFLSQGLSYTPLVIAVFIGGQIGSRLSAKMFKAEWICKITGILIALVSCKLLLC